MREQDTYKNKLFSQEIQEKIAAKGSERREIFPKEPP
jgi:hypothetical protein